MKSLPLLLIGAAIIMAQCTPKNFESGKNLKALYQIENGKPVNVMLTAFSTTLIANGLDHTKMRIALSDSIGKQITNRHDTVQIYISGDGLLANTEGKPLTLETDTAGAKFATAILTKGTYELLFYAGTLPGKVKVEARSGKLWPGSHEIHTIPANVKLMVPTAEQLPVATKPIDKMIGADISFLPQLEDRGFKFYEDSVAVDAVELMKKHGFNYIRLRIFVNPETEKGYAPGKGYCNLTHTLAMAKRVKEAGMKVLLDFHYSDYWADPQQQNKPLAWQNCDFATLKDSVKTYTARTLAIFKAHGLMPEMVQIGNEINHGLLWPDDHIGVPDQLAELLKAGIEGAKQVDANLPIMMHVALGGQNQEAVFWFDNMIARGVEFDIIGLSYYARWHGTLDDLQYNLSDLIQRYHKSVNVVEYNDYKKEVHDISFGMPNQIGKGACVWEPLSWNTDMVLRDGNVNKEVIMIYDALSQNYLK